MTISNLITKLSVAIVGSGVLALGTGSIAQAASFVNPANGNTYFLTDVVNTWTGAQSEAVAKGGNLVTINDAAEQAWLLSVFGNTERLWIGLNDFAQEGTFEWVSGQPYTYQNWAGGEPNNQGNEDYVVMNWAVGTNGGWNDLPNAGPGFAPTKGIIEIESTSVPESSSAIGVLAVGALGVGSLLKRKQQQKAVIKA